MSWGLVRVPGGEPGLPGGLGKPDPGGLFAGIGVGLPTGGPGEGEVSGGPGCGFPGGLDGFPEGPDGFPGGWGVGFPGGLGESFP